MPDTNPYALTPASAGMPDPLSLVDKFSEVQNRLNTNRLFQQTFQARQKLGQIISQAPDLETGLQTALKDPSVAPFAGEYTNAMRQGMLANAQYQGEIGKQASSALDAIMKSLPGAMSNPSLLRGLVNSRLATVPPLARDAASQGVSSVMEAITGNLPNGGVGPEAIKQYNKNLTGLAASMGWNQDTFAIAAGKPELPDTGVALQPQMLDVGTGVRTNTGAPIVKGLPPTLTTGAYGPGGAQMPAIVGGYPGRSGVGVSGLGTESQGAVPSAGNNALSLPPAAAPTRTGNSLGLMGPSLEETKRLESRGVDMADYQKQLDARTSVGGVIMQTLTEARDAQNKFTAGGGASTYTKIGQVAQALGAPQSLVDRIANGDLSASQEFNKLMVNTTMGQIREQLSGVGASRLSQMEFAAFNQNNPNIDTDPRAIEKIFNFWTKLYTRDHAEQTEMSKFQAKGGDMSQWPSTWQDIAQKRGYISPQITSGGKSGSRPPLDSFFK